MLLDTILNFIANFIIYGVPLVLAITLHEAAHGYSALKRGDNTALRAGRLSLNPLRHVDPLGTLLIPLLLILWHSPFIFGYAKPVPVNFNALKNPKRDMVFVAAAGPFTNFGLALLSALLMHFLIFIPPAGAKILADILRFSVNLNVTLAVFNLLPLPPLDGGRIAVALLPEVIARPLARLERWGMVIIFGGFIILPIILSRIGIDFNPFKLILQDIIFMIIKFIGAITSIT